MTGAQTVEAIHDIFSEFDDRTGIGRDLVRFLADRLPEGRFRIVSSDGVALFSAPDDWKPDPIGDVLPNAQPSLSGPVPIEPSGQIHLHTVSMGAVKGYLEYRLPDAPQGFGFKPAVVVGQLAELFFSRQELEEKEALLSIQKKQLHRKLTVLEKRYQEILEENLRGHQVIQEQLNSYSQKLMDEIRRQTAALRSVNCELESKRRLQQKILDTAATAIYTLDLNRRITDVNEAFCAITGYAKTAVIGQPVEILEETACGSSGESFPVADHLANHQGAIRTRDGRELKIIKRSEALLDESGGVIGAVESFADVTDLIDARERAEAASKAKSAFLAAMSHEIRTPLNAVIGFTDMLLDSELKEEQTDYARTIKRSGEALLSLIDDILDFSKVEAGQLVLEAIDFDPEVTGFDVCDLLRSRTTGKSIEILCRIGDTVPAYVCGDPGRFRQVLLNLVGNAAKFTEAGEIELSVAVAEEKNDRIKLHIRVRDTGIGIPPDKLESIFDLFQQADGATTRKYGGTGLGLSICRKIAGLMDGAVWAESPAKTELIRETMPSAWASGVSSVGSEDSAAGRDPRPLGPGSIFHFTCWLKKSSARPEEKSVRAPLAGKRALIVDDNAANLDILRHMLEAAGMRVVSLDRGDAAAQTVMDAFEQKDPIHVGVIDILLGDMTGFDVVRAIRQLPPPMAHLPMLAFSSSLEKNAQKCRGAGFDGFLPKPIRRKKLYQMLERLLGEQTVETAYLPAQPSKEIHTQYSLREAAKHGVRILLAEDNLLNQKLTVVLLTRAGYQVDVAGNGKAAVEKYTATGRPYDLIFMDIQMPEMDGLQAARAIRRMEAELRQKDGTGRRIPIIAMTANVIKGDRETCLDAGMDDYVAKPIKREIVFEMVEKYILREAHNAPPFEKGGREGF